MDNCNAIEVRNMSKKFKLEYDRAHSLKEKLLFWNRGSVEYHNVLNNINLDIKKGETVALIGTNGSGKSTLLKLMTKIIFPNSGTVKTQGKLTSLLELGAGFHIDFTGRENIYFNASIFGLNKKEIDERIDKIIEFSELGDFIDYPIRTYSSGMYMRLAFSVAINVDAEILLIDEILAVGDQHFQEKCYRKLRELRDAGKTIVIVTHSLDAVKELCHRAVWIYKGNIQLDGSPEKVINEYLNQIAIDNRDRVETAQREGRASYSGVLFIDNPKNYFLYKIDKEVAKFNGWMVTDSPTARLCIKIDGHVKNNFIRTKRQDVYDAYREQYAGFLNPETLGWEIEVDLKELGIGLHTLRVECIEPNNNVLYSSDSTFQIE